MWLSLKIYIKYKLLWPITILIKKNNCRQGKHGLIGTVLDDNNKPEYKWCMHCNGKFSL